MSSMKIMITGATGFIGSALVRQILADMSDTELILLCRSEIKLEKEIKDHHSVKVIELDLNFEVPSGLGVEPDLIIHLSATVDYFGDSAVRITNSSQTKNIMAYSKTLLKKPIFIFASTLGAVDRTPWDKLETRLTLDSPQNPTSEYGKGKLEDENIVLNSGLDHILILRLPWVIGPGMRGHHVKQLVSLAMKNKPISRVNWPGHVGLIAVDELSKKIITLMRSELDTERFVDLSSITYSISIGDIFGRALQLTGHKYFQIRIPILLQKIVYTFRGLLPFRIRALLFDVLLGETQSCGFSAEIELALEQVVRDIHREYMDTDVDVFITGCSSGLGWQLARLAYTLGYNVFGVDLVRPPKEHYFKSFVAAELTLEANLDTLVECWSSESKAQETILVNNAGISTRDGELLANHNTDYVKRMIQINFEAPIAIYTRLITKMKLTRVINISSSSALMPIMDFSIYGATKTALHYWTLGSTGISDTKFHSILPSGMKTALYTQTTRSGNIKGALNPETVARKIYKYVGREKTVIFIGRKTWITFFMSKFFPQKINIYIFKLLSKRFK